MPKRGRTPSLISSHGKVSVHVAGKVMSCRRCKAAMPKGTTCVRVADPGYHGPGRAYCNECFEEVLGQTELDIRRLRQELA